jgi:hypothetical protein
MQVTLDNPNKKIVMTFDADEWAVFQLDPQGLRAVVLTWLKDQDRTFLEDSRRRIQEKVKQATRVDLDAVKAILGL